MTINLKNFLNDKQKLSKMGEFQELEPIEGLEISAVSADLYGNGRDDLCLFYFKDGTNYAAVYTNNSICSESIVWNRKIRKSLIKALLVNTKNANTFTGPQGQDSLQLISKSLAKNLTIRESQKKDGTTQTAGNLYGSGDTRETHQKMGRGETSAAQETGRCGSSCYI